MSPIAIIALIIGIPALLLLVYVFARGSTGLRRYILTRIALTLPMIFILATMVFFILRILPGDPVTSALGPKGTPEMIQHIRATLGLNDPLIVQYGRFLWNMVTLRFGNSLVGGHRPIIDEMSERFPATLELIIPASILRVIDWSIWGGFGRLQTQENTRLLSTDLLGGYLFPTDILVWVTVAALFRGTSWVVADLWSHRCNYWHASQNDYQYLQPGCLALRELAGILFCLEHLVLPTITLGLILSGVFLRMTRINVIETMQADFIGAARARGIRERILIYGHALKNAMIPVITLIGLQVAILLAGAVLTETVFSWPGMGSYLVERISARDYTAVQSVITVFAILVALISLAVDVIYSLVDPRVRY